MKYPDHEFEEHLAKAKIFYPFGDARLCFAGWRFPISEDDPNKLAMPPEGYPLWTYWMEAFDNAQREAIQAKLIALRVQERLSRKIMRK